VQYWERKHPDLARRVVGAVASDLEALTQNQVLAIVREWYDDYDAFL
jgi:hypothetical protein